MSLSFDDLRAANTSRAKRWHPGFPDDDAWTGADWSNAMCGEAGEAANVVKKLRRHECLLAGSGLALQPEEGLLADLALELADTVTYLDLLAAKYGIDLGDAVARKFNIVSERQGFPERLPCSPRRSGTSAGLPGSSALKPTRDSVGTSGSANA